MRISLYFCIALMGITVASPNANATLIGDTVLMQFFSGGSPQSAWNGSDQQATPIVEAGPGDLQVFSNLLTVDIESEDILIEFTESGTFDPEPFLGLTVDSLDWTDVSGRITGLVIDTDLAGWADARAEFDDHSVSFNWENLTVERGNFFNLTLETIHGGVPEPTTATLSLVGLAGLLARRRRAA